RTTLDLKITVSDNFQSVSNGILVASASEGNGNRRDHWKMDRPIPTGQIMLAVGEFDIIEKDWKGISVRYMGESIREEGHDAVFGQTMEMMEYFSTILDYPFPWPKFDQLVVREDPFHEMPGASVCFLSDDLLVKGLESDRVYPEKQISHAVFHQWFGSLVTSESWAHWSLMESLATYAEQLWMEHSYGQEIADLHAREELNAYLTEAGTNRREVIRYFYTDPKELLDMHSSAKGARIWDMLRTYVGDEAFFAALHHFLVNHAYQSVELDDFRLSFEAVTGEDLKWFFIQWFQNAGHPQLEAWHQVVRDTLRVHVRQVQDLAYYPLYRLPMYLDVDKDGQSFRYLILVENQVHVFQLPVTSPVASLQLDGDFQLLGTIIHQKEEEELLYQYQTSPTLAARMEAIIKLAERGKYSEEVLLVLRASLSENEHPEIQKKMLSFLLSNEQVDFGVFSQQVKKLTTSGDPGVRVLAMEVLVNTTGEDLPWETYLEDPSLQVQGMALGYLLNNRNPDQWVSRYKGANSIYILLPLANYFNNRKKPGHLDWYIEVLKKVSASEIIYLLEALSGYLPNANAEEKARIIPFLYEIGRDHPDFLTRFFAVEALRSLAKEKGVNEKILEIQALERDIRLLEIYKGQ
ncbi:MAG: M1 family aminopeptidase, partial [Cyclobacteriaceae bacterium]|nr:M1 family aminopeptidase [Cyclobacteriaceae bacterium]